MGLHDYNSAAMPVPLPGPDTLVLTRPDADEVEAAARGVASAAAPSNGLTEFQRILIESVFRAMTGHPVDLRSFTPMTAEEFATLMARRDLAFRSRMVQAMLTPALVLRPLPAEVADHIAAFARELGVDDAMIDIAREFSHGAIGLAAFDFERNGYTAEWTPEDAAALHTSGALSSAWDVAVKDPELAGRWASLAQLPAGALGRRVWETCQARGFVFPGLPGSAPPLLAQPDWVHVLADYGTTVEAEIEVFGLIGRANEDPRGFSLLAMVIGLFETGYIPAAAGIFRYDRGHLSKAGMACRLGDAMRRGALCGRDLMAVDWFELADRPVDEVRETLGVVPKDPEAVSAGSRGPWEPGGISPFQFDAGRAQAEAEGRSYDPYGAAVS